VTFSWVPPPVRYQPCSRACFLHDIARVRRREPLAPRIARVERARDPRPRPVGSPATRAGRAGVRRRRNHRVPPVLFDAVRSSPLTVVPQDGSDEMNRDDGRRSSPTRGVHSRSSSGAPEVEIPEVEVTQFADAHPGPQEGNDDGPLEGMVDRADERSHFADRDVPSRRVRIDRLDISSMTSPIGLSSTPPTRVM